MNKKELVHIIFRELAPPMSHKIKSPWCPTKPSELSSALLHRMSL